MFEQLKFRKAQLGMIEMQYFAMGFGVGLVVGIVVIILSVKGVIPLGFVKSIVCGAAKK